MNFVLILAGMGIQMSAGENRQLDLYAFLAPFLYIFLPVMALIPVPAVLLEGIGFLSGGFVPGDSNVGFDPASTGNTFLWMGVDSTSLGETGSKSSLRRGFPKYGLQSY